MNEESIFIEALKKETLKQREAFLDQACAGNDELRRSVESLLQAHEKAGSFLRVEPAALDPTMDQSRPRAHPGMVDAAEGTDDPAASPGETPGVPVGTKLRYFGDYELLEEIARGGMGVIYKARQVSLNRIVAVKMILAGRLASDEDVQRFHKEAEAAANLHHPGIVAIHEVGKHEGQQYFSMDYVEGKSLAELVSEMPLPAARAASYVKATAEAIHYAHEQGTLHRDLKPSNVLVDASDNVRITDFGLAKRVQGDSSLTGTGAILGTPGYMPPEQAASKLHEIGPCSDVYSLGAILYELLTGRPPFRAETPIDTLMQVLEAEPAPPRLLNPKVPRDLETICLKCLQKEPRYRYRSAEELADDLRRFLNDEPIRARRVGRVERTWRWVRRQRRSVIASLAAAAGAVLLVIAGSFGWTLYDAWRTAYLKLDTDGPTLHAEVFDERGNQVKRFNVPHAHGVALPSGSYRVRLSAPGHLSETYLFQANRRSGGRFSVDLSDRHLWDPIPTAPGIFEVVDLDGRPDLITVTEKGLRRLNGATVKVVWDVSLAAEDQPAVAGASSYDWESTLRYGSDDRARLVRPLPDLDRDGTRDLVWASPRSRKEATLLAVSGKEGRVLWWLRRERDLDEMLSNLPGHVYSTAVAEPTLTGADEEGVPDLIVTFAATSYTSDADGDTTWTSHKWVEALAGSTGETIWRYPLGHQVFPGPQGREGSPFRAGVMTVDGRAVVICAADTRLVSLDLHSGKRAWDDRDVGLRAIRAPQLADLDNNGRAEILLLGEDRQDQLVLMALTSSGAAPIWQKTLSEDWPTWKDSYEYRLRDPAIIRWPLLVDLDGDDQPEVIVPAFPKQMDGLSRWGGLEVLDAASGQSRWRRRLRAFHNPALGRDPFIAGPDLDGDGCRELFVATAVDAYGIAGVPFVDALSGKDGHTLWWSALWRGTSIFSAQRLQWWQLGPDAWPQLVVSTAGTNDVVSVGNGRTTHTLSGRDPQIADLDGDGIKDLCALDSDTSRHSSPGDDHGKLFAIRGMLPEAWRRLGDWQPAEDLDADGIADLVNGNIGGSFHKPRRRTAVSGRDGRLLWQSTTQFRVISGRVGPGGHPGSNGDNRARLFEDPHLRKVPPLPHGDLDGDGTPDVLEFGSGLEYEYSTPNGPQSSSIGNVFEGPLLAFSGKTGRQLWVTDKDDLWPAEDRKANRRLSQFRFRVFPEQLECRDLDGDGDPEVVFPFATASQASGRSMSWLKHQFWLAILSGRTGKLVWKQPLGIPLDTCSNPAKIAPHCRLLFGDHDLNDDGVIDLLAGVRMPPDSGELVEISRSSHPWHLLAVNGATGKLLWQQPLSAYWNLPDPVVGDLDGDGASDVVVSILSQDIEKGGAILALDGRNGQRKWSCSWPWPAKSSEVRVPAQLANLDGDGSSAVCVHHPEGSVVILDGRGQVRQSIDLKPPTQLRVADLDSDGKDELLLLDGGELRATKGGVEQVLWARPGVERIAEILSDDRGQTATVVTWEKDSVFGLDGATGKPIWRGPATGLKALITTTNPEELPRLVFKSGSDKSDPGGSFYDATVCRLALPTSPAGEYLPLAVSPRTFDPPPKDPRLARRLPWLRRGVRFFVEEFEIEEIEIDKWTAVGVPSTFIVVVVPVLLVYATVRRRSWKLGILAAIYLGGLTYALYRLYGFYLAFQETKRMVDLSLIVLGSLGAGLPSIFFLGLLLVWIVRRQWARVGILLGVAVALGLLISIPYFVYDAHEMGPSEYYSWSGWYWIGFFGAYTIGALAFLALFVFSFARLIRGTYRTVFTRSIAAR